MIFDPYESHQLTGKHAALYRESLGVMLDVYREVANEGDENFLAVWSFGVTLFDELDWRQQVSLLLSVSRCVLNGSDDPEEWNALEKAAFYAVYRNVFSHLEIERDIEHMDASEMEFELDQDELDLEDFEEEEEEEESDESSWQDLISGAYQEKCLREGLEPAEIQESLEVDPDGDGDLDHWHSLLESLADQILDDRDFEMASTLMDADPEIAEVIKAQLGIQPDYFVATAEEPTNETVSRMFRELALLAGLPIPDQDDDETAPF